MKCPQCAADNPDGKNFCSECGVLLTPQLIPIIRTQVEEYLREQFNSQELVDVRTTEAIAARFLRWGKWFLIPATILVTLLGITLGVLGIRDFSDVRKASQQAITESGEATNKAVEAETKSNEAIKAIDDATGKMKVQISSAQTISDHVSGLEQKTASQIAAASQHVEGRITDLDQKVEAANKTISEEQAKLLSTDELVKAMFSQGLVETFETDKGDTSTFAILPLPAYPTKQKAAPQAVVYMLLKSPPIYQTVQINFRVYVQPKSSYIIIGNVIEFFWGEPAENVKQWPLEVSYVPDPAYHGPIYKTLVMKDGRITPSE